MRLIDADTMMERLKAWDTEDVVDKAMYNFALNRVLEAPTVEPKRKMGHWIPLSLSIPYTMYQCDCCFRNAPMVETGKCMNRHLEALLTDFCPNCGADMRGEDDG